MLKLYPPTHKIDAPGVFIFLYDDAWDQDRINAEMAAEIEKRTVPDPEALAEIADKVRAAHPFARYYHGHTRFQLDAPAWDLDGKPCKASDYLKADTRPVRFVMRRLAWQEFERAIIGADIREIAARFIRSALVEIQDPSGAFDWRGEDGKPVPESVLQALWNSSARAADRSLFLALGTAARLYSAPLTDNEGKPFGCGDSASGPPLQPKAD